MESKMEQNSGESRSGETMSIFGQSIDVRRPARIRRRAIQKKFSPAAESPAEPSLERLHQRRAVAERERARAESELSRASSMASELEQQIEQANATARSHRPELQGTRAGGSRRKKAPVDVEAPGADHAQGRQSNSLYVEVMHELDRVKRELRQLQREVKAARDAQTPTPRVSSSGSRRLDTVTREAGGGNEGRGIAELAEPGGSREATRRARGESLQGDTSRGSDPDERFATASSSDVGLESAETTAMVPATAVPEASATGHVENGESALTVITQHEQHDDRSSLQQAAEAEAELTSARTELASIRGEGARLTSSMERTRREAERVAEEIGRLAEQEGRAGTQVRQLNARLARARSRLGAATAAEEGAEAALAELAAALRRVGEETEAAEKERALAELESRCVREDAEAVAAEAAAAERRVRELVGELEAARAAEAAAAEKLSAAVVGAATTRDRAVGAQRSGNNVTIPRFEYEYLAGRAEVVRAVAGKKVAAAEAWVEALRAGKKEVVMRAEAIEREIGEMAAGEAVVGADDPRDEERELLVGLQRAQTRRRPAPKEDELPATVKSTAIVARKPRPLSFSFQGKKRRASVSKCMKCFAGRC